MPRSRNQPQNRSGAAYDVPKYSCCTTRARYTCGGRSDVILSLFAGCGGLDLGFERVGFSVALAYDIRPSAIASWNRNRHDPPCGHVADLSAIRLSDMDRDNGGRFIPTAVIGGPPCQSFSRANHFRSRSDPRYGLVSQFFSIALRLHRHRRPLDFILMENVPDLARTEKGRLLDRQRERLESNGFVVIVFQMNAIYHTVPQHRKRLFVLAVHQDAIQKPWVSPDADPAQRTVRDAIYGLPEPIYFRRGIRPDAVPFHPNHWCMNPRSRRFSDGSLAPGYSSGRSFKTLAWDSPSPTVSYGHREVHVHPTCRRRLSVFEAMRLQGFPDYYALEGTLSAQIDQVSEAVPPPLAVVVAKAVRTLLTPDTFDCDHGRPGYAPSALSAAAL